MDKEVICTGFYRARESVKNAVNDLRKSAVIVPGTKDIIPPKGEPEIRRGENQISIETAAHHAMPTRFEYTPPYTSASRRIGRMPRRPPVKAEAKTTD